MSPRSTFVFILLSIFGSGCSITRYLAAANRSTRQFLPSPKDPRVFYEPGAEQSSDWVAEALPSAITTVEASMFAPFQIPIRIYVCATIEILTSYGASPQAGGHTINHRIFLSPKPENTHERIPRLITHELSHLHLGQKRRTLSFTRLPVWFVEGLAVDVSHGGGAEDISEPEARLSIAQGKTFVPETTAGIWHHKGATAYHLTAHMFYRQAGMFVAYLRAMDEMKFREFLGAVEDGAGLGKAFRAAYGEEIRTVWGRFVGEMVRGASSHA